MERVTGVRVLKEEIREALGRGAVVVTGNERAARTLRREYDEVLRASGRERWEPGKAMSWTAWTGSLWRRMLLDGQTWALLLNNFQEHAVWRGVLAGDEAAQGIRGLMSWRGWRPRHGRGCARMPGSTEAVRGGGSGGSRLGCMGEAGARIRLPSRNGRGRLKIGARRTAWSRWPSWMGRSRRRCGQASCG